MDCFMQDVKETLTFIPGPWCLTAVLWLACFWTFLKHTQKNVLVQWKKLHLAKRQPSGQEWEQSTEQTRSSAAFTERTGADLLEHTVYEAYRWCAPPLGFTWQLPFIAAGIQTKTDRPQVRSWLQVVVQALRSGFITFTQNPFFSEMTPECYSCNLNVTVWHFLQLGLWPLCLIQMLAHRFPGWGCQEYFWLDHKPPSGYGIQLQIPAADEPRNHPALIFSWTGLLAGQTLPSQHEGWRQ